MTATQHDNDLSHLLRSENFQTWRREVTALGGCAAPIHLTGSARIQDRATGTVLAERDGDILAPCGNRRASVCPACSDRYASDAYHLIRAGMAGGKGVPDTATDHPRVFVTLTAPSFGPVHTRRVSPRGLVIPCSCGDKHHPDDPRIGTAADADAHDYVGAILWQAHAGKLWNRFTIRLRRLLAGVLGVKVRDFPAHARLSYAKVAEYQRRGLVHFHAVVRLDGPDGPVTGPPTWIDTDSLNAAVRQAAQEISFSVTRPDGSPLVLAWGSQVDTRPITSTAAAALENDGGEIIDAALAAYVAKYATKGTGKSEATDRPIRDITHLAHLDITPHHRRLIETAWELGGQDQYEALNLRRWAHMLGFRGHFLTKSRAYSTTFGAIRGDRRTYQLGQTLAALDNPAEPGSVLVVNDWAVVHIGHRNDAEREIALGIAERRREQRTSRKEPRRG
ncbi:replication initiation protein [Pseudonocardia sp. Ae168_Ps1]|uniref:replication initiator n=1 Tax=unclassified Pseudonocardia TaxID=2619320 RepID=UPI00094B72F0|nr:MULTISPECIES: replication initiator [unclassified Pseudonocardia]OLL74906.1 replication initiation protein [Pseudonocardia sp. Ae150A_Ps1]OLL80897.1 replication initiation protein [Pseudonocardia sp. Ae168_Ps1]OLL84984.1 replication initiation protein [Pseudonocardia sp. Ae263_Ps1]OLL94999.1 replication initiation protein [Pseudonocardia sp. Ae356_Ps1]